MNSREVSHHRLASFFFFCIVVVYSMQEREALEETPDRRRPQP